MHELQSGDGGVVTSLLMPAWRPGGYYGVKIVNVAPGNAARGLPGLHSSYLLHDAATGVPLALIDGNQITSRRTAAASALAASFLARTDARHLLVVGAGRVAALLPEAYREVRPDGSRHRLGARPCGSRSRWRRPGAMPASPPRRRPIWRRRCRRPIS